MVLDRFKGMLPGKEKREQRRKERAELDTARETEELKQAEQLKKEADRLAQLKQYKPAVEEYRKAIEVCPYTGKEEDLFENAREFLFKVHFNLAACFSYLDEFEDAVRYFDKAIAIDINDSVKKVKALMAKGSCYYRKKLTLDGIYRGSAYHIELDSDEKKDNKHEDKTDYIALAHSCFAEAVEVDPSHVDGWYNKGHMEFIMGRIKEAVNSFDEVINRDKNYENKERVPLFDEIRREKGISVQVSGILDEQEREEKGVKTKTGHFVRNKAECQIADFLFENNIMFQYNVPCTWADGSNFRATFYLPKLDLYLDHFKTDTIKESPKVVRQKVKQYEKHKKHYLYTTSEDERHLAESVRIKLKPYIIL